MDTYKSIIEKSTNFFNHMRTYFNGHHNIWVFIPDHSLPIAFHNIKRSVDAHWVYNDLTTTLTSVKPVTKRHPLVHCKFSWLSAKIRIQDKSNPNDVVEYDIDEFLQSFNLLTSEDHLPSLYIIFISWCVYVKHWFNPSDTVEFHVINDMGEDMVLDINDENITLELRESRIHVIVCDGPD